MIFKIYDCTFGFDLNGTSYTFEHVNEVAVDDPSRNHLTRGANESNEEGIVYTEGSRSPKVITLTIMGMAKTLAEALQGSFKNKSRLDLTIIASDGSTKNANKAILTNDPMQKTLNDSVDSMNVELIFESFSFKEVHKT
jgi:hypothetical protein